MWPLLYFEVDSTRERDENCANFRARILTLLLTNFLKVLTNDEYIYIHSATFRGNDEHSVVYIFHVRLFERRRRR